MATESERLLQRILRAVSRWVLRRGQGGPVEPAAIRRVLVIRSDDRVGNVLLTTPLLRALREGLPHVRVDWLIAASRRPLVEGLFLADTLIPFDKRVFRRNPLRLLRVLSKVREARYDVVIDAAHHDDFSLSTAMLTRWTAAPVRIGHDRGDALHFYTHAVPLPPAPLTDAEMKLSLLEPLGLRSRGLAPETALGRSTDVDARAEGLLARAGLAAAPFLIVNPGARKPDRRYAGEAFGRLVQRLATATGLRGLVVWGPGEEDLARTTVAAARDAAILAPSTDLDLLAALLRRATLLITNDTGPMHLGVACGTPVLALFTADAAERWGHRLPAYRAIPAWSGAPDPVDAAEHAAADLVALRAGEVPRGA